MIGYLRGRVLRMTPEIVVLDVNGVGYLLTITASARDRMPARGDETELHVFTHVREDQLALYGFSSVDELEMFRMLIEVDGVGPKVGIAILSSANLDLLKQAILAEDVGPEPVREEMGIQVEAAKRRGEPVEHVLLAGPPGLGKTTLAYIIGNELGVAVRTTSGPAIDHAGALGSILMQMADRDVFFIDEIHRLNRVVEESLYPALEDFTFDTVLGKGVGASAVRLPLQRFTCVGATTRQGLLSAPLRDRFGAIYRLDFYSRPELARIVRRAARVLALEVEEEAVVEIARRSRGTPRIANRLLRRVRDYAQVRADGVATAEVAARALSMLSVDAEGLDPLDRRILETIIHKGLDLQGGSHLEIQLIDIPPGRSKQEVQPVAVSVFQKRLNALGTNEPLVQPEGQDRIVVELAGVSSARAIGILGQSAHLD